MKALGLAVLAAMLLAGKAEAACPAPAMDQVIDLPGHPFVAEPSPDNCRLFVSLMRAGKTGLVAVLTNDAGHFRLTRTFALKHGSAGGVALSHDGTLLGVAGEDAILLLDVGKLESPDQDPMVATLPEGGKGAIYALFSKDDTRLFISEERNNAIAVIDVAAARQGAGDKAVVGRIQTGEAPVGLALSPDGTRLFSTSEIASNGGQCAREQPNGLFHGEGGLAVIDTAKAATDPHDAVLRAIRAGCNPVRVVVSADGHSLWISQRGEGKVSGMDLSADAIAGQMHEIAVGPSPVGLALRPDGVQLWVANSNRFASEGGSIALITPASPGQAHLANTLKVGAFPRDLRFLPDGKTLVVALFGQSAVMLHPTDTVAAAAR